MLMTIDAVMPKEPFDFEKHRMYLFWIPELRNAIGRYYSMSADNNLSIDLDARFHVDVEISGNIRYQIGWDSSNGKYANLMETIYFNDDNGNLSNLTGPSIIQNGLKYDKMITKEGKHETGGFISQVSSQWFYIEGILINNTHAEWLANYVPIPWTEESPITEKIYAMFLLRFNNKNGT